MGFLEREHCSNCLPEWQVLASVLRRQRTYVYIHDRQVNVVEQFVMKLDRQT
jgi:hypothetical protein